MCDEAEKLTKKYGIVYEKQIVNKDELILACGGKKVRTYPQILVDQKHIGTNFDLEEYFLAARRRESRRVRECS